MLFRSGLKNWTVNCWGAPGPCSSATHWATLKDPSSKLLKWALPPQKSNLISCGPMAHISDIKLIRTDTTLDLSQKAEKGMLCKCVPRWFYSASPLYLSDEYPMWDFVPTLDRVCNH